MALRPKNSLRFLISSDAFRVIMITSHQEKAEDALLRIKVAAVITIPSGFDTAYNAHKPDPVTIHINNLNLDFTNDLRRSLPAAITDFYGEKNNQSNPIKIHVSETDLRKQDIDLLKFEIVPNLILLLTTAGIVNAGLATAREWEDHTIKELLLAPISKTSLIAAKILSGWITTLLVAAAVLLLGAADRIS